eukprot:427946-Lingulodinium_polyedra.AAC.1
MTAAASPRQPGGGAGLEAASKGEPRVGWASRPGTAALPHDDSRRSAGPRGFPAGRNSSGAPPTGTLFVP